MGDNNDRPKESDCREKGNQEKRRRLPGLVINPQYDVNRVSWVLRTVSILQVLRPYLQYLQDTLPKATGPLQIGLDPLFHGCATAPDCATRAKMSYGSIRSIQGPPSIRCSRVVAPEGETPPAHSFTRPLAALSSVHPRFPPVMAFPAS